ncbi:hypothetical protein GGI12_000649 [Dipsacomyces acuminosporus]|nr:hypothetical protein GGI12_000649 [Dipsacomyces acuminosporus]
MKTQQLTTLVLALGTTVSAQFGFSIDNTDANAIYSDIQAAWNDWASAGNDALQSAKKDYPDAYAQLTDIYGADKLPGILNVSLAKHAASKLAGVHSTTIWDKNAGNQAEYSFAVRDLAFSGVPTPTGAPSGSGSGSPTASPTATGTGKPTPKPTGSGSDQGGSTNGEGDGSGQTGSGTDNSGKPATDGGKTTGGTTSKPSSASPSLAATLPFTVFVVYAIAALAL